MSLIGVALKALYQLHRHKWSNAPLDRWLAIGLVFLAGLAALNVVPGGRWTIVACAGLLAVSILSQLAARRVRYLVFRRVAAPQPAPALLRPDEKIALRATGLFEVEGKEQAFTELAAYLRSFNTREHAVMAVAPPSRFLALGVWPEEDLGMWYIFFKSREVRQIESGVSYFGRQARPALRLTVDQKLPPKNAPLDAWGIQRKEKPKTRRQTLHFSFDAPLDRDRVLANLLMDAPRAADSARTNAVSP